MGTAPLFPCLFERAVDILLPFATTYACEQAFSALAYLKNKHRSRLDPAADMRLALSATEPRFDLLLKGKQYHPSH
uniref:Putative hat aebuster1 orf1-h 1e-40-j 4 n=1 Tax=Amblyomma triste TaxID=251400 RepID=A0A023G4H0_AMBTT